MYTAFSEMTEYEAKSDNIFGVEQTLCYTLSESIINISSKTFMLAMEKNKNITNLPNNF